MSGQSLRTDDRPEDVVWRYSDMVYRLAFARTRNRSDADDIFQEVFYRYLKKQPTFASEEHRKAWLIRVTINCAKKLWASPWRQRTVPLEENLPFDRPEENRLHQELMALPERYRTVLHLFYYEDLSVQEISRILKRKPSTVRMQLTRARGLLKTQLKEEDDD